MINEKYADYAWEQTAALLAIDSPSGFTRRAAEWVKTAFEALGFPAKITTKGGVLADLGGENADDGLFLEAHSDTLGAMVAQIKGSGRLRLTAVGGMEPNNAEAENGPYLHPFRQGLRRHLPAVQCLRPCQRGVRLYQAQL